MENSDINNSYVLNYTLPCSTPQGSKSSLDLVYPRCMCYLPVCHTGAISVIRPTVGIRVLVLKLTLILLNVVTKPQEE